MEVEMCTCNHTQDKHKESALLGVPGHGSCTVVGCTCTKFTWTTKNRLSDDEYVCTLHGKIIIMNEVETCECCGSIYATCLCGVGGSENEQIEAMNKFRNNKLQVEVKL